MIVQENFSTFKALREKYPRFIFESFTHNFEDGHLNLDFRFRIGKEFVFKPRTSIKWKNRLFRPQDELSVEILDILVFNIGMAELSPIDTARW